MGGIGRVQPAQSPPLPPQLRKSSYFILVMGGYLICS